MRRNSSSGSRLDRETVPHLMALRWSWQRTGALEKLARDVFGDLRFDVFQTDIGIVTVRWREERPMDLQSERVPGTRNARNVSARVRLYRHGPGRNALVHPRTNHKKRAVVSRCHSSDSLYQPNTVPCGTAFPVSPCGQFARSNAIPGRVEPASRKALSSVSSPVARSICSIHMRRSAAGAGSLTTTIRDPSVASQCGR
jgi:hypothetical protein